MNGRIHSFETMGALDGPGIRFIVFMQGCPLRCMYCHNPDTWNSTSGVELESRDIIEKALRYSTYFGKEGGVTLSGGEPLLQTRFTIDILKGLKANGIHTALDTSGYIYNNTVKEALKLTDLVILDIKHSNPKEYKRLTGGTLVNVLKVLKYVDSINKPIWIRQVIVSGINDSYSNIEELAKIIIDRKNVRRVELLPYHTMGINKWRDLGKEYSLSEIEEPSNEKMEELRQILRDKGINAY